MGKAVITNIKTQMSNECPIPKLKRFNICALDLV
jgi:hypothetical protein